MKRKLILLSGVHGVGKGHFLKNNFPESNRFIILEASKLIGKYKKADDAGYKKVKNVSDNQQILLAALESERKITKGDIILDGYLCLLNAEEAIERIPEDFLIKISVNGVVLLQDNIDNIVNRQNQRDGIELSSDTIKMIQEEEIKYCEILFLKYEIPYRVIYNTSDYQKFSEIVDRM